MTRPTLRPSVRAIIVSSLMLFGLAAAPGVVLAQPPPETIEYYATDALGSVRVVFTPTGQVIGRSDYLPFGDTLEQSGMLPRQRFTGQERDGLAGLDDFNARSLQMRTGRMSSPDPLFGNALVNPQRWNRYAYVLNNPLKYTDPTGMDAYDNDASVRAANAFARDYWGLEAWDDFSREPWAIAWGYSYGPFSPRELYNSAFTPRDGGGGGDVTTSYYISIPGLLPSRPLGLAGSGAPASSPGVKPWVPTAYEKANVIPWLKEISRETWPASMFGLEWAVWKCSDRTTVTGPFRQPNPNDSTHAVPHNCPPGKLEWYAHSHTSPSGPSDKDMFLAGQNRPSVGSYMVNTDLVYFKYTSTQVFVLPRW